MAQGAIKIADLSSITRTQMVESTISLKLFSDHHKYSVKHGCPPPPTHKENCKHATKAYAIII